MCLETAESGGLSAIASASALYRTIAEERPDLIPALMRGFRHHRRGQHPPGESPLSVERIPVFSFWNGELHCRYNRNPIEWTTKEGEVLTAGDRQALEYFDAVVARPGVALARELERGDMQFNANFEILQPRTASSDAPARHIHTLRLRVTLTQRHKTDGEHPDLLPT